MRLESRNLIKFQNMFNNIYHNIFGAPSKLDKRKTENIVDHR